MPFSIGNKIHVDFYSIIALVTDIVKIENISNGSLDTRGRISVSLFNDGITTARLFKRAFSYCELLLMLTEKVRKLERHERRRLERSPLKRVSAKLLRKSNWYQILTSHFHAPIGQIDVRDYDDFSNECIEITDRVDDRLYFEEVEEALKLFFQEDELEDENLFLNFNKLRKNFNATVLIVRKGSLFFDEIKNVYYLPGIKLSKTNLIEEGAGLWQRIHHKQRYASSYTYDAVGTGVAVTLDYNPNESKVITAAHLNIKDEKEIDSWNNYLVITNFNRPISSFRHKKIQKTTYKCIEIKPTDVFEVTGSRVAHSSGWLDLAVLTLKSKVNNSIEFNFNSGPEIRPIRDACINGSNTFPLQHIYAIGHGLSQYKKLHLDSVVLKKITGSYQFMCSLDMYHGNSGSPVFDETTHQLIGILSSGINKFELGKWYIRTIFVSRFAERGEFCQNVDKNSFDQLEP